MVQSVIYQAKRFLQTSENLYHRLVILVGENGSAKTLILRSVAHDLGVEIINVNLALSTQLLELNTRQRSLRLPELFTKITEAYGSAVVLDNLEILFDMSLHQDPLRLLQGISRNRSVVAAWNGRLEGNKLTYSEPGHPEYRSYESRDILIVSTDGTSTFH